MHAASYGVRVVIKLLSIYGPVIIKVTVPLDYINFEVSLPQAQVGYMCDVVTTVFA